MISADKVARNGKTLSTVVNDSHAYLPEHIIGAWRQIFCLKVPVSPCHAYNESSRTLHF